MPEKQHTSAKSAKVASAAGGGYRPSLPDWGAYLRWPVVDVEDAHREAGSLPGASWIHPEDTPLALKMLPSRRVFRRTNWDGEFYHLHYGEMRLRVRPSMWLSVPAVDLEVGQQVELLSRDQKNDPGLFRIADILLSQTGAEIEFYLRRGSLRLHRRFERQDLRPLRVQHALRVGFYPHQPARACFPPDLRLLNVGKLTN